MGYIRSCPVVRLYFAFRVHLPDRMLTLSACFPDTRARDRPAVPRPLWWKAFYTGVLRLATHLIAARRFFRGIIRKSTGDVGCVARAFGKVIGVLVAFFACGGFRAFWHTGAFWLVSVEKMARCRDAKRQDQAKFAKRLHCGSTAKCGARICTPRA